MEPAPSLSDIPSILLVQLTTAKYDRISLSSVSMVVYYTGYPGCSNVGRAGGTRSCAKTCVWGRSKGNLRNFARYQTVHRSRESLWIVNVYVNGARRSVNQLSSLLTSHSLDYQHTMLLRWDTSSSDPLGNSTQNSGILPPSCLQYHKSLRELESLTSYSPRDPKTIWKYIRVREPTGETRREPLKPTSDQILQKILSLRSISRNAVHCTTRLEMP